MQTQKSNWEDPITLTRSASAALNALGMLFIDNDDAIEQVTGFEMYCLLNPIQEQLARVLELYEEPANDA